MLHEDKNVAEARIYEFDNWQGPLHTIDGGSKNTWELGYSELSLAASLRTNG